MDSIVPVVCLDYGIFAEETDVETSQQEVVELIGLFITENSQESIIKTLSLSSKMIEQFWALYRREDAKKFYEKLQKDDVLQKINENETKQDRLKCFMVLSMAMAGIEIFIEVVKVLKEEIEIELELNKILDKREVQYSDNDNNLGISSDLAFINSECFLEKVA